MENMWEKIWRASKRKKRERERREKRAKWWATGASFCHDVKWIPVLWSVQYVTTDNNGAGYLAAATVIEDIIVE